jgi:hypothetical protein
MYLLARQSNLLGRIKSSQSYLNRPFSDHATLDEWIKEEVTVFSLGSTSSLSATVDGLMVSLDPSLRILGLEEALQSSEDILLLRNRLFQHLEEEYGFAPSPWRATFLGNTPQTSTWPVAAEIVRRPQGGVTLNSTCLPLTAQLHRFRCFCDPGRCEIAIMQWPANDRPPINWDLRRDWHINTIAVV